MKRFLTMPNLMKPFLTSDSIKTIRRNIPIKKIWTKKYKTTKESMSYFYASKKKERKEVRNAKYYGRGYGGVVGIEYEEVTKITNQGDDDWKKFLQSKTYGITKRGQLLVQIAIESYVYSVLGSQVETRWTIVGSGAKSYQTQSIFHRTVKETIIEVNESTIISNMFQTIIPGVILIPSNLIILDKPIKGYNNVLTVASKNMKFGKNDKVNFTPLTPEVVKESKDQNNKTQKDQSKATPKVTNKTLPRVKLMEDDKKFDSAQLIIFASTIGLSSLITYLYRRKKM